MKFPLLLARAAISCALMLQLPLAAALPDAHCAPIEDCSNAIYQGGNSLNFGGNTSASHLDFYYVKFSGDDGSAVPFTLDISVRAIALATAMAGAGDAQSSVAFTTVVGLSPGPAFGMVGNAAISPTGVGTADIYLKYFPYFGSGGTGGAIDEFVSGTTASFSGEFISSPVLLAPAGAMFTIQNWAQITNSAAGAGASFAAIELRNRITVDPTYLAAHPGLIVELSPGVQQGIALSPVSEEPTYAMWIAGFGLLGAWCRKSNRRLCSSP